MSRGFVGACGRKVRAVEVVRAVSGSFASLRMTARTGALLWGMSVPRLLALVSIFFATSVVSVVTGSTSLITVPAMLQFHIDPKTALATNMFALTFLSAGALLPFGRSNAIPTTRLPILATLTLAGSILGAVLLLLASDHTVSLVVPLAMIGMAIFSLFWRKNRAGETMQPVSRAHEILGYVLTFVLGIYGGFFSGGYVTLLTAVFVIAFGSSFREAIATTKLLNLCSSAVATAIFMYKGLVDYKLGAILGLTMFVGAALGARVVLQLAEVWLRRIFFAAVWMLGLKALFFDLWHGHNAGTSPDVSR
jgi:uncharacterized protein